MKTQKSALKSVLKKLSALRVTLSGEEQKVLDGIVVFNTTNADEVEAHTMSVGRTNPKTASRTAPRTSSRTAAKTLPAADEVEGHAMTPRIFIEKADQKTASRTAPRTSSRTAPKTLPAADEVEAHAMTPRIFIEKADQKTAPRIALDAEKGEYKIS